MSVAAQAISPRHRFERDLVEEVEAHLPTRFAGCQVHREVAVGRVIADAVALVWPQGEPRRPSMRLSQPFSVAESVALAMLRRHGAIQIDRLPALCGLQRPDLERGIWRDLVSQKLLKVRNGKLTLGRIWPTAVRVIAIEAKLTKWREALRQATEYRRFADFAYVALPESSSSQIAARERSAFYEAGIGLFIVNGHLRTLVRARRSREHDWRREFVVSRLVGETEAGRA
jgi:hypothetical protein